MHIDLSPWLFSDDPQGNRTSLSGRGQSGQPTITLSIAHQSNTINTSSKYQFSGPRYEKKDMVAGKSTTTRYYVDANHRLLSEKTIDDSGIKEYSYVYFVSQRLARISQNEVSKKDEISYFLTDAIGSVAMTTYQHTASTNVPIQISQSLLDPWGNSVRNGMFYHTTQQDFTGKVLDEVSGLYDFGFRYYDPLTAAWIGKDLVPADHNAPLSLNEYLYCLSNPLTFVDPDGREAIVWIKIANPTQPRYESAAIVYPNGTIPNFESIKGLNYDQVIKKFGKPLSIQNNLSSLPDSAPGKPSKFGTVAEGEYEYSKSTFKGKPALKLPDEVKQDENTNGGLNPRYGTGKEKRNYLEGVYAHTGWFGKLDACINSGSEGCLTGWDGPRKNDDYFSKFMNSLKDQKGNIFISRPKY